MPTFEDDIVRDDKENIFLPKIEYSIWYVTGLLTACTCAFFALFRVKCWIQAIAIHNECLPVNKETCKKLIRTFEEC